MAQKKLTATDTADTTEEKTVQHELKSESAKPTESAYTIEELSANANHLFGVNAECVVAALKEAGVELCTVSQTEEIVRKFMRKEIQ